MNPAWGTIDCSLFSRNLKQLALDVLTLLWVNNHIEHLWLTDRFGVGVLLWCHYLEVGSPFTVCSFGLVTCIFVSLFVIVKNVAENSSPRIKLKLSQRGHVDGAPSVTNCGEHHLVEHLGSRCLGFFIVPQNYFFLVNTLTYSCWTCFFLIRELNKTFFGI